MVLSLRTVLWSRATLPFGMALALVAVTAVWTGLLGLSWEGPAAWVIVLAVSPLLLLAGYVQARQGPGLAEALLFGSMYLIVPLFGVRLSYLVTTLNFPLIDASLDHFDRSLGFDWAGWADVINGHKMLHAMTFAAYMSPVVQALGTTAILAYARPRTRNVEMLFTMVLALMVVIAVYTVFPEVGPSLAAGRPTVIDYTVHALRAGRLGPLPYAGIVSFPSYHTVMAIVFTYAHRRLRSFWPVAVLNAVMLLGTPTYGDHYVADMCAGAVVAACAIMASRAVYGGERLRLRLDLPVPQAA